MDKYRDIEEQDTSGLVQRAYRGLSIINNFLLIPLFALMILEASGHEATELHADLYLAFCLTFLVEWILGFIAAEKRWDYFKNLSNLSDLLSSIPFGMMFQGFRMIRLLRLLRLLRVVWRTRRFQGKAAKIVRAVGLVGSLIVAAAIAFRTVEPDTTSGFEQALWWAVVTLSTVGYGDVMPVTPAGHVVAIFVIFSGLGVFGYMAGVMTSILDDGQIDSVLEREVRDLRTEIGELKMLLLKNTGREGADGSPHTGSAAEGSLAHRP